MRLLRRDVEAYLKETRGKPYIQIEQAKTELKKIRTRLSSLELELSALRQRKELLVKTLAEAGLNERGKPL